MFTELTQEPLTLPEEFSITVKRGTMKHVVEALLNREINPHPDLLQNNDINDLSGLSETIIRTCNTLRKNYENGFHERQPANKTAIVALIVREEIFNAMEGTTHLEMSDFDTTKDPQNMSHLLKQSKKRKRNRPNFVMNEQSHEFIKTIKK